MVHIEPATLPWMEALDQGDEAFTEQFGILVVPGWAAFPEVIPFALQAARAGEPAAWGVHLTFDADGALAGNGGWKDSDRFRSRAAGAACSHDLQRVVAHTLPEPSASTTVLTRCGLVRTGELVDPNEGLLWRWELGLVDSQN